MIKRKLSKSIPMNYYPRHKKGYTLFQTCCKYVLTTRTEGKDTLHFKPSPARTRV